MTRARPVVLGALLMLCAIPLAAQSDGMLGTFVDDYAQLESKFNELAGAMDADMYDWRPMEGVRSVSEVYMLIAAEGYYLPSLWGATPPEGITVGPQLFDDMAAVTAKEDVQMHLERAFAYARAAMEDLTPANMENSVQFFGRSRPLRDALYIMLWDMHEHLGQSIAYARSNRVVPPWTERQQGGQ